MQYAGSIVDPNQKKSKIKKDNEKSDDENEEIEVIK